TAAGRPTDATNSPRVCLNRMVPEARPAEVEPKVHFSKPNRPRHFAFFAFSESLDTGGVSKTPITLSEPTEMVWSEEATWAIAFIGSYKDLRYERNTRTVPTLILPWRTYRPPRYIAAAVATDVTRPTASLKNICARFVRT